MSLQFFRLVCFKLVFSYKIISNARFWQSRTLKTQKISGQFHGDTIFSVQLFNFPSILETVGIMCVLIGLSGKINSFSEKKIGKSYAF